MIIESGKITKINRGMTVREHYDNPELRIAAPEFRVIVWEAHANSKDIYYFPNEDAASAYAAQVKRNAMCHGRIVECCRTFDDAKDPIGGFHGRTIHVFMLSGRRWL